MEFKAKAPVNLDLDLEGSDGEKKTFPPKDKVSARFIGEVNQARRAYFASQSALPEPEKDLLIEGYIKSLTFVYELSGDDVRWIADNFSAEELGEIATWVIEQTAVVTKKAKM